MNDINRFIPVIETIKEIETEEANVISPIEGRFEELQEDLEKLRTMLMENEGDDPSQDSYMGYNVLSTLSQNMGIVIDIIGVSVTISEEFGLFPEFIRKADYVEIAAVNRSDDPEDIRVRLRLIFPPIWELKPDAKVPEEE